MGGAHSQKLLPWRGRSLLSGAQTSGSQPNQHQHCTEKLGRISVGAWLSYTRPGSFLESTSGPILTSAEADRNKGVNYLKCRGHCALRICGTVNGGRVRESLKTRDLQRAARRVAEREQEALGPPHKLLSE